jgi:acetyl esterase/lipase
MPPAAMAAFILAFGAMTSAANAQEVTIERDVVYAHRTGLDLMLAIATVEARTDRVPALIFLPGNGWGRWGGPTMDRRQYWGALKKTALKSYVAVSIDISPISITDQAKARFPFPTQLFDVKNAIRWVRAHADQYGVDPDRIGLIGWSSGGHLALLAALTRAEDGMDGDVLFPELACNVQAVVSMGAPTDLASFYAECVGLEDPINRGYRLMLETLLGGTPDQVPEAYRRTNPVNYVRTGAPPVLSIYGSDDEPEQAHALDARMKEVDAEHTLKVIQGMGHENVWNDPDVMPFFDRVLKPAAP